MTSGPEDDNAESTSPSYNALYDYFVDNANKWREATNKLSSTSAIQAAGGTLLSLYDLRQEGVLNHPGLNLRPQLWHGQQERTVAILLEHIIEAMSRASTWL